MPRRLAVAKHAGGFDAVGWTLLGFLLGASLAVFALLHADIRNVIRPFAAPPAPAAAPIVTYAAPAPPQLAGPPPVIEQTAEGPGAPIAAPAPPVDALAVAGAASVHAAATDARPKPASGAAPAPSRAASEAEAQVDDDAAAAGMTSRATAPAPAGGPAATPHPTSIEPASPRASGFVEWPTYPHLIYNLSFTLTVKSTI